MKKPIILPRALPEHWADCSRMDKTLSNSVHPILERVYAARGVFAPQEISRELSVLHSYHTLLNIEAAAQLLAEVLMNHQKIMIVGDFDADGATSTALAVKALTALGGKPGQVVYLVPNRFEYGYGLSPEIVDKAAEQKPDLIVTVDNGISSFEGVERASELGIRVLITDHHLPGEQLPKAAVIVNPNQPGDTFPSKNLAGVGVIFYVMLALRAHLREAGWFTKQNLTPPNMLQFLDLVALGTVADVVPLDQNNRILVHWGIERIRSGKACPGIKALLSVAKRKSARLTASDLGFAIGPRLNAAGRLEDMTIGITCLLTEKEEPALQLAAQLDGLNQERQFIEKNMREQALKLLDQMNLHQEDRLPTGLCLYHPEWHQGVVGILAARVKEQLHRPVIVFTQANETEIKGSARSVPGLHIRDALDNIATQNPELMSKFGGHAMAAGLSLKLSHLEAFKQVFDETVTRLIDPEALRGKIWTDGALEPQDFTLNLASLIQNAGPWGQNFPEPVFDNEFLLVDQRIVGEKYLKLLLKIPETEQYLDAIAFKIEQEAWPDYTCKQIRAVYRLDVNEYQGVRKLQLVVEHVVKL